jgi:flagellin-specific chaperone FliS
MSGKINIFVKEVKEKSFLLGCINESKRCKTIEEFAPIAHLCFSNFIMALNIATLGNFIWNPAGYPFPLYRFIDPQNRERKINMALRMVKQKEKDIRDITKAEIRNTALLYGALCKEDDLNVRKEYIKGILHLSSDFFDIDFYKEAFGNFYRSFERFSTERILKVKKLTNELKDLQKVIKDLGFGDNIADEFHHLYELRCNQIMHAQKKQFEMKIDDALKMKTILDAILHKVYKPVWEKGMKNCRTETK